MDGALQRTLEGPGGGVDWLQWHPRGTVLLAGSEDFSAWLWNVSDGSCMQVHRCGVASNSMRCADCQNAGFRRPQRACHLRLVHAGR